MKFVITDNILIKTPYKYKQGNTAGASVSSLNVDFFEDLFVLELDIFLFNDLGNEMDLKRLAIEYNSTARLMLPDMQNTPNTEFYAYSPFKDGTYKTKKYTMKNVGNMDGVTLFFDDPLRKFKGVWYIIAKIF